MPRQELIDYIKQNRAKGYSDEELKQWLLQNHFSPQNIDEAFNSISQNKPFNKKLILIIAAAAIIIGGGVSAAIFLSGSECGNGVVEKGEFPSTCCIDTGCTTGMICEDNQCVNITIVCDTCEYEENGTCVKEACCNDDDCDDNESGTTDSCTGNPKQCFNEPILECLNDDNHCPVTCTSQTDNDCDKNPENETTASEEKITFDMDNFDPATGELISTVHITMNENLVEQSEGKIGVFAMSSVKDFYRQRGTPETDPKMRVIGAFYQILPQGEPFGGEIEFDFCYLEKDIENFDESTFYIAKETPGEWEKIGGTPKPEENCVTITWSEAPDYTVAVYAGN